MELKSALDWQGVCSVGYSGHSFRIGAATAAAEAGIGDAVIQQLGRWRSAAYKGYVQLKRESLAGISRQMLGQKSGGEQHFTAAQQEGQRSRQSKTSVNKTNAL